MSKSDFIKYTLQEEDDAIVCSFGPAFFAGARFGAGFGSIVSSVLCYFTYRKMKLDQQLVDTEAGLKRGQFNPNFSRWVVLRGLKTQPMLASGCIALSLTTVFKIVKYMLASQRCYEFYLDDMQFLKLQEESSRNPALVEELSKELERNKPSVRAPQERLLSKEGKVKTVKELLADAERQTDFSATKRRPTYKDGVAVGAFGSVLDCYVPQKPLSQYYNMRAGF